MPDFHPAGRAADTPLTAAMPEGEPWLLLESGAGTPAFNMAFDEALLQGFPLPHAQAPAPPPPGSSASRWPVLRLYGWTEPAATFGYSQRYADAAQLTPCRPLIRRPTGGGVVPHGSDWTYTLAFPPTHPWYALRARESYERLHRWLQAAFRQIGFATQLVPTPAQGAPTHCFVRTEQSDVLWQGAKIAGAAQRRTRQGLLIQGSIQPPPGASQPDWVAALLATATRSWGVRWCRTVPDAAWVAAVQQRADQQYAQDPYNRRR